MNPNKSHNHLVQLANIIEVLKCESGTDRSRYIAFKTAIDLLDKRKRASYPPSDPTVNDALNYLHSSHARKQYRQLLLRFMRHKAPRRSGQPGKLGGGIIFGRRIYRPVNRLAARLVKA